MAELNKIVKFCEDYLKVDDFKDYCINGMQIEGSTEVGKIITGVSFSEILIKEAIAKNADMVIVHHGLFIEPIGSPPKISGYTRNRLKLLLQNDISLLGFHLPLDAHPVIGNNVSLCKLFDIKNAKPFDVGFYGELEEAIEFDKFTDMVSERLDSDLVTMSEGPTKVKNVGIISGGASPSFEKAAELGLDTFICGDIREGVVRGIEEVGINFINAGHYNTEKLGVQNLGELIAKEFKVDVEFIDIPCDI